jgi:hypothetical protein
MVVRVTRLAALGREIMVRQRPLNLVAQPLEPLDVLLLAHAQMGYRFW